QEERDIAAAAAQQRAAAAPYDPNADAPTVFLPAVSPAGGPPPGADPYGLLSGRDNPDNPSFYAGDPAGPTEALGPGPYGQPLGYGGPAQGYGRPPGDIGLPPAGPDDPTGS